MASKQLLSNLSEYPSRQPNLEFDYEKLAPENRTLVQQRTNEIKNLMRLTTQGIIEIGLKLIDAKAQLRHGNFRNWLEAEFSWSVKTANRFMQVAENFKCVKLTHLNITDSALYFLASPSTPQEARVEALKRATLGENINYTLAKVIVSEHKQVLQSKSRKLVSSNVDTERVSSDPAKPIEQKKNETNGVRDLLPKQLEKEVEPEVTLLSTQYLLPDSQFKDRQDISILEINGEQIEEIAMVLDTIANPAIITEKIADPIINEIEIKIENLSEERLAQLILVTINFAKKRLSKNHLAAIIKAVQ